MCTLFYEKEDKSLLDVENVSGVSQDCEIRANIPP